MTESTIDITKLSKTELLELYREHKLINIAHRLWCLEHTEIPVNFSSEFVKLLEKLNKLVKLNVSGNLSPEIMLDALIDSIYSDCRGLFCENEKNNKNYTLQNCLKVAGLDEAVADINDLINRKEFSDEVVKDYSFREWVKLVTDKSIAHKDNLTEDIRKKIDYRCSFFNNMENILEFQYYIFQIHRVYEQVVSDFGNNELNK